MVNQAGSSKRNQPRAATRKSYSVRGDSGSTNRSAKSSSKPKFNPNSAKSSTSSNSSSSSRYKRSSNDAERRSTFRKPTDARSKPKNTLDSKSSDARSERSSRDRQSSGSSTSNRNPYDRNQSGARRTDSATRSDRSSSERSYSDRAKPLSSAGRSNRTGSAKPRTGDGKPGERSGRLEFRRDGKPGERSGRPEFKRDSKPGERSGRTEFRRDSKPGECSGSRINSDRPRRDTTGKPRSSSDRERGGRDRDQDRPQKFDTPRRFRGDLPRRERDQRARGNAPVIDDDITGDELGDELNTELRSLPTGLTITVAQHLVMTQRYLEINPELALLHANHAKELAGRFPLVREIVGVAQYVNGNWQEALNDFRAVKRMAVADHLIPLMADCERGLGRPEKAIAFLAENRQLTGVDRIEAAIVEAGARSDLEQYEAAQVALKIPALTGFPADQTAYARLCFAYASVLTKLNQQAEAQNWYRKADSADPGATDAAQFLSDAQEAIYLDDLDAEDDK